MCWYTYERPIKLVAEEDLSFYKFFSNGLVSPIREFKYSYNTLYTQKIQLVQYDKHIDEGFHWYITEHIAEENNFRDEVLRIIIPKGSHYYINEWGEGVSDMMYIPGLTKPSLLRRIFNKIKKKLWIMMRNF